MSDLKILCMIDMEPYPEARKVLESLGAVTYLPLDHEALVRHIPDFHAYYGHVHVKVDRPVLERAGRLMAIACPATGTDHIDMPLAKERRIEIINIKTEYELLDTFTATAELAWGLLIACMRELPTAVNRTLAGHRDLFVGHQLSRKTLGILGYGRLGRMVAEYGKAFRMRVLACDVKGFSAPEVERVDFETLLRESDAISLHIHLAPETEGIIGRAEISRMKPGVVLINTARGALIDEDALVEGLETGQVGAAGLDVIRNEWDGGFTNRPLIAYAASHANVVITPHMGGSTWETNADARLFTAKKLVAYLRKRLSDERAQWSRGESSLVGGS